MAFTQIISGASAGDQTQTGFATLENVAQGATTSGFDSLVVGRRTFVHDPSDLGGAIDFIFTASYSGFYRHTVFGGDPPVPMLGTDMGVYGYFSVRNLDLALPGLTFGLHTEFGNTLVYQSPRVMPIDFDLTTDIENRWGGQLPIQFGSSLGDLVFTSSIYDFAAPSFTVQLAARSILPPGFDASIPSTRWWIHTLPAPVFNFGADNPIGLHPAVNFPFGPGHIINATSPHPVSEMGFPTVRLLDHNTYQRGIDSLVFGNTLISYTHTDPFTPAGYALEFHFLYDNLHAQFGTNTAIYFFASKYVDPVGADFSRFGTPTVQGVEQELYISGFDSLEVGDPRIIWLRVTPEGFDASSLGNPTLRRSFREIFPQPFGSLGIGTPDVSVLTHAEMVGLSATLFGTASLRNRSQFIWPFGSLFTLFGTPKLPLEVQYIGMYGSRNTAWGLASVTNAIDAALQPSGWTTSYVSLNHRVELQDQAVYLNTGADRFTSFGVFEVADLLPQEVAPEGLPPPPWDATPVDDEFFVSHSLRRINFAGLVTQQTLFGGWAIRHQYQYVAPEWSVFTYYGQPDIVRYLEVKPNGYPHTEFGEMSVDLSGVIFWDGFDTFESSGGNVKLGSRYVLMWPTDPHTTFGPADLHNLNQFVEFFDIYENSPRPFETGVATVGNYDRELRPQGFLSFDSKPYLNTVFLGAAAVAPTGISELAVAKPLVSHDIRYVTPTSFESSYCPVLQPSVHNAAHAIVLGPTEVLDAYGSFTLESNRQWIDFYLQNVDTIGVSGASQVADRVRYIVQRQIDESSTGVGDFYIGLYEQYVQPPGLNPTFVGAPTIVGPFFTTITPRPVHTVDEADFCGLPDVRNRNFEVALYGSFDPSYGYPQVYLFNRYLSPTGFEPTVYERPNVTWADRSLRVPGAMHTKFSNLNSVRNLSPDPPWDQRIIFEDYGVSPPQMPGIGVRPNSITFTEDDMEDFPDVRFGSFSVFAHTIQIIQSWDSREFGIPHVGDLAQFVYMNTEDDDPVDPSRIYISPRYIFMRTDEVEHAYYENLPPSEQDGRWKPLDETGQHDGWTSTWVKGGEGRPAVSHKVRYITDVGGSIYYGNQGRYGEPTLTFGTNIVAPESINSLARGFLTIIPHTKRISMKTTTPLQFGEVTIEQEWVDPRVEQTVYMAGSDFFTPGALDPQKWIREIYMNSWVDTQPTPGHPLYPAWQKVWGNNTPMVYFYPRGFALEGYEATEYGDTWVSHRIRWLEMTHPDDWTDYYHPGMLWTDFSSKMAVRNVDEPENPSEPEGTQRVTVPGLDTQIIGEPTFNPGQQVIGAYMIAPPCVIGIYEVAHG